MVGIPLFGGFSAKVNFSTASIFDEEKIVLTLFVLGLSSILNALYYIPALINIWSGKTIEEKRAKKDLTATVSLVLLACGVLFLGVCFTPVMRVIVRGLELM
jgi:multicomponent Na+:H+ antiporter subunit D